MEQTGNEIISGVRRLWREWRGICSNIWEVIRCESPTCVLQKPCFSHTHIKLHHGEQWRWERLYAWVAGAGSTGFQSGIQNECCVIPLPYIFLYPLLWWVWIGWDITTTNEETIICEYLSQRSLVSYSIALPWAIHPSWHPSSPTLQLPLHFSTSHFPPFPHHYLQSPHTSLKTASNTLAFPPCMLWALCRRWLKLCQAQNLLEEHNLSDCMLCFQPPYISPGGWPVLANLEGCG